LFDSDWYLSQYPDVAASGENPLEHFLAAGAFEGRDPHPLFDSDWYLSQYPDVAASGENPLEHFLASGAFEGRDPNPLFDSDWYLSRYPDVARKGVNWLTHFVTNGQSEGRQPGPLFLAKSIRKTIDFAFSSSDNSSQIKNETDEVRVSIVIPVHGQWHWTERCLRSLLATEAAMCAEIIVVNDCSKDDTLKNLERYPGIRVIDLEENVGFTKASNIGAAAATSEYLFFLNNDTEVFPDFLEELLAVAQDDQDVAIVGSRLVYPDGYLQEVGSIIWSDGSGHNFGRRQDLDAPEYQVTRDMDYCTGAAILVRSDFFNKVGGFDERYSPAYYEDVDLAFLARSKNKRVVSHPNSVVIHHEGGSHGTDITKGVKAHQVTNKDKFVDKWHGELSMQYRKDEVK
jgi:GT2 family glycosyltransferase